MKQLEQETIKQIVEQCLKTRPEPPLTKTHKGAPDGAYDTSKTKTRIFVHNEFAYLIASKLWIDSDGRDRLPEWMQVPWGSYPDLP